MSCVGHGISRTKRNVVRNMSGMLYQLMSCVECGIFGTRRNVRNMLGACQECVRNDILINVTCVGHQCWSLYLAATLSTSSGPITMPGALAGGVLVGDNRSICLGLVEIVIVCSQCVI